MSLTYGPVKVLQGKHKGKIGYYDDDDCEENGVVYFGTPFTSQYHLIPTRYLQNCEPTEDQKNYKSENAELCQKLGVNL